MKKKIMLVLSALIFSLILIPNVNAINVAEAGESVNQKGEYASTRFIAGNNVTSEAVIDGISFVAGNEVNLNGKSSYGFFAGNNVNVNEEIEKDLFVAGNGITIGENAKIGRDAYIAGNVVNINSDITRDLRCGASTVYLNNVTIGGDVYIDAEAIVIGENTVITGKLSYLKDTRVEGLDNANIGSVETREVSEVINEYELVDRIKDTVFSAIAGIITLIVLFYLIPNTKEKLDNLELSFGNIAKNSCIGLALLIVVPILSIIAMVTRILLPLSIISLLIYCVGIYLSFLLVSYIIGNVLMKKVFNNDNQYLAIIFGVVVIKAISYIPYINGLVMFISLVYGLSLLYKYIISNKKS